MEFGVIHRGTKIRILDVEAYMSGDVVGIRDGAIEMQFCINETDIWRGCLFVCIEFIATIGNETKCNHDVRPDKFGYVYLEFRCGMYGLKEAGIISFKQLVRKLAPAGYHPCKQTAGLWTHATKRTTFTLCVDDFGVKYFSKANADHLISSIK